MKLIALLLIIHHDTDSKRLPFEQASSGVIGFESLLPLTLKLINDKKIIQ